MIRFGPARLRAFASALRIFKRLDDLEHVHRARAICDGCGSVLFVGSTFRWRAPGARARDGMVTACGNCKSGLLKRYPPPKKEIARA